MGELFKFSDENKERLDMEKAMSIRHVLSNLEMAGLIVDEEYASEEYTKVSGHKDEEIIRELNDATEQRVEDNPLFFSVLLKVAESRGLFKQKENK